MTADFWTSIVIDKRISRAAFATVVPDLIERLSDRGCAATRASRFNGSVADEIFVEGWIDGAAEQGPQLNPATVDPEKRI